MIETGEYTLKWLCSLIPYLLVGWLIHSYGWGNTNIWMILGIILLARLGFNIMEAIAVLFARRRYYRARATKV
jgi:hypothetical protein